MVSRLSQVPLLRAVEQPKWCSADLGEAAAADPAAHQPGEQVARPPPVPERLALGLIAVGTLRGQPALPRLDRLPQLVVDDPQLGHLRRPPAGHASFSRDTRLPVLGSLT